MGSLSERRRASSILGAKPDTLLGGLGRTDKDVFRASHVTADAKCEPELAGELGGFGNEVDCAGEQIHGRRRVRPLPRANARAAEPLTADGSELAHVLVLAPELCQVSVRLLEVVAHELVRSVAAI